MNLKKPVWGFNASKSLLYSKNSTTGQLINEIPITIALSEIKDMCTLKGKIFILTYTYLHIIKLSSLKKSYNELPLRPYSGIIPHSNHIYLLSDPTLKFDVSSRLVRKTFLSIPDSRIITKSTFADKLYVLLNSDDKLSNTLMYVYSTSDSLTDVIQLKERLNYDAALSVVRANHLLVFGGKHSIGWASDDFFCVDLENLSVEFKKRMVRAGIFNMNCVKCLDNRMTAIDSSGFMHIYDFNAEKWKIISEKHWNKRKCFVWVWDFARKRQSVGGIGKLTTSLVRKLVVDYL